MKALVPLLLIATPALAVAGGFGGAWYARHRTRYAPRVVFAIAGAAALPTVLLALVLPYVVGLMLVLLLAFAAGGAGFYVRSRWLPNESGVGELGQRHRERLGVAELIRDLRDRTGGMAATMAVLAELVRLDERGNPRAILGHGITRDGEPMPHVVTVPIGRLNFGVVALLMGGPGTGKTTTAIRMLWAGAHASPTCSILIADPKGDKKLRENAQAIATRYGMRFWEWTRDTPLDPLASVSGHDEERVVDVVERLMAISTWEGNAEFFAAVTQTAWQRAARFVLAAEIPLSLHAMADAMTEHGAKRLLNQVRATGNTAAYDEFYAWIDSQSDKKWAAMDDTRARLESLANSGPGLKLAPQSEGGASLEELLSTPTVAYLHLDSNRWPDAGKKMAQLLAVALMQDAGAVAEQGRLVRLFVDELAAIPAERLDALLQRGRSAGFDVYLATQTLAGIGAVNAALTSQITGTLSYAIAHRSLGQSEAGEDDAERLCRMGGTRIEQEITTQVHGGPMAMPTGAGSSRQVDSYIVHPNTVRSLGLGQAAIIDVGQAIDSDERGRLAKIVEWDPANRPAPLQVPPADHAPPKTPGLPPRAPAPVTATRPLAGQVAAARVRGEASQPAQPIMAVVPDPTPPAARPEPAAPKPGAGQLRMEEEWPEPDPSTAPIEDDEDTAPIAAAAGEWPEPDPGTAPIDDEEPDEAPPAAIEADPHPEPAEPETEPAQAATARGPVSPW